MIAAAAAAAACDCACLRVASAIAWASVCWGCSADDGDAVVVPEACTVTGAVDEAAPENVDLTFDSSDGRRPGSGSSANGLGNVVSPVTGEGRDEVAADAEVDVPPVSIVRCAEFVMLRVVVELVAKRGASSTAV